MTQENKIKEKGPHDGHKERMRKRFVANGGFNGFSDHEILEVLLNYTNVRKNTNEIAHKLIERFGSFNAVFEAEADELMSVEGVGERTAVLICMQRELFRVYSQKMFDIKNKKIKVDNVHKGEDGFFSYVSTLFAGARKEQVYMLCVSPRGRVTKVHLVGEGSSDCVIINQKEMLKLAIYSNAYGVILVHNHVTGILTPSYEDVENTKSVQKSFEAVGIKLVEHFVYTEDGCVSILKDARFRYMK